MNKYFINILILLGVFCIISIIIYYNYNINEHFYITTWTPYVMDCDNQPCYSNYFFMNNYMYPIY